MGARSSAQRGSRTCCPRRTDEVDDCSASSQCGKPRRVTSVGASLTQVQDNNQRPSPVSGSQKMDTSMPPPSPKFRTAHRFLCSSLSPGSLPTRLADIASQLQVLMSSMRTIMTTVGQLGGQMKSFQAEVTEMKIADNRDDDFDEHCGFPSDLTLRDGAMTELRHSETCPWVLAVGGPPWVGPQASSPFGGWAPTPPRPSVWFYWFCWVFSTAQPTSLIGRAHAVIRACQPTTGGHVVGGSNPRSS